MTPDDPMAVDPVESIRHVIARVADQAWEQEQRDAQVEDARTYREAAVALHGLLAAEPSYETRMALMLGILTLEARADVLDGGEYASVEVSDGIADAYRAYYGDHGGAEP